MAAAGDFWVDYQPGFRYSGASVGSPEFFREVEEHRYRTEPAIRELADFGRWDGKDVLELGCGIATDGIQFARHGARYVGLDRSETAVEVARGRFEQEELPGTILQGSVTALPVDDRSVDFVYSNGVLHHTEGTEDAIREAARVLRPGGRALVMLYHRSSLNYYVNIMVVRRALAALLSFEPAARALGRVSGEAPEVVEGHRELLREHGLRYLTDPQLFLNNNTDGPGNPLSKVYTRASATAMFAGAGFARTETTTRFLNLRLYPRGEQLAATPVAQRLERRIGWHLWIDAVR